MWPKKDVDAGQTNFTPGDDLDLLRSSLMAALREI